MITRQTQVVNVEPDLDFQAFGTIADPAPVGARNEACYAVITHYRVSTAFLLAIFLEESAFGTVGLAVANKNPGNRRSSVNKKGLVVDTVKGKFCRYSRWEDGWDDLAYGFVAPNYLYARTELVTIEQIIYKFAPPEDGNDTEKYIADVVHWMNQWLGSNDMAVEKPDITWYGSPNFWQGRWGEDVLAIVDHRIVGTLGSADGWFNNRDSGVSAHFGVGKNGAIHQYVSLADSAWANGIVKSPDLSVKWLADFVKRGDNPNHCTVSIEHEGQPGDAFPETQYQATLKLHKWLISQFPKITVDRQGINGHYQILMPDKANCPGSGFPWTRLINDLTAWKNAGGGNIPMPDKVIVLNGHQLGHGFLDYFNKNGGVKMFGLPTTDEYTNPDTGCNEQKFERYWMEFDPREKNPDWQIRGKIITSYIN